MICGAFLGDKVLHGEAVFYLSQPLWFCKGCLQQWYFFLMNSGAMFSSWNCILIEKAFVASFFFVSHND